jgi:hypothetical protein
MERMDKRVFRRDGVYLRRFWWWYPWGLTRWWLPRVFLGGDEWCNVPLCIVVPPLGCFLFFQFWRPMRTTPCPECWGQLNEASRADYQPGGMYEGGP